MAQYKLLSAGNIKTMLKVVLNILYMFNTQGDAEQTRFYACGYLFVLA